MPGKIHKISYTMTPKQRTILTIYFREVISGYLKNGLSFKYSYSLKF